MNSSDSDPAITSLRFLLNQFLRILINDGRIFLGSFLGTDQALNLLLMNTNEFRVMETDVKTAKPVSVTNWDGHLHEGMELENPRGRYIGQVVIPWKQVVKVEAHGKDENAGGYCGHGLYI
ncbi:hypothetical protein V5O48_004692 [Marasmius crinis-equi]|uniref:LSM domain-containing protein n=1 Tax=Marasmius crinis-equi TaxID=585013 RepID=A0ABR3FPR8_9AGAR